LGAAGASRSNQEKKAGGNHHAPKEKKGKPAKKKKTLLLVWAEFVQGTGAVNKAQQTKKGDKGGRKVADNSKSRQRKQNWVKWKKRKELGRIFEEDK